MSNVEAPQYECNYCNKHFYHESRFLKHKCKWMKREEEFQTPLGQAAWGFYQKWMRYNKRIVPGSTAFKRSKYYSAFVKFAKFKKDVGLPNVDKFMRFMRDKGIQPNLWTDDTVYSQYLEFLDHKDHPISQAKITIDTILSIVDVAGIKPEHVFDMLTPNELLQLIRQRRMSPWVLLHSPKFRDFMVNRTTNEEQILFQQIIRPKYWKKKFENFPNEVEKIKIYIKELGL